YAYIVLELVGGLTIQCSYRPAVGIREHIFGAQVDHRFDREYHILFQLWALSPPSIIREIRYFVLVFAYFFYHTFDNAPIFLFLCVLLDSKSDIADTIA